MLFGKQHERKFPYAITRCVFSKEGLKYIYMVDDKSLGSLLYPQVFASNGRVREWASGFLLNRRCRAEGGNLGNFSDGV